MAASTSRRGRSRKRTSQKGVRGRVYRLLDEHDLVKPLLRREITQVQVAEDYDVHQSEVSRALTAWREDLDWQEIEEHLEDLEMFDIYDSDDAAIDRVVDDVFPTWRATHFADPFGQPYTTPGHQRRWLRAILTTIRDGGRLLILSPPRHGKTELLIHLDVFLITRCNPNVRIMKVCASQEIAKIAVGSVMDTLDNSISLAEEVFGDSEQTFRPEYRDRRPWSAEKFTISTRNITGLKAPTMVAVGSGGSMLSRDADIICLDDVEDDRTTLTPNEREKTRHWFANTVESRKEARTALIAIGSRQHPDDLWGHIIDNPNWEVIVEDIHDDGSCPVDVDRLDDRDTYDDHGDCLLWPDVRDWEWHEQKRHDPEVSPTFAMTYKNQPQDAEADMFSRETFESVRDLDRIDLAVSFERDGETDLHLPTSYTNPKSKQTHHVDVPWRLIAGLDPSATGYQVAALIAFDPANNHQRWLTFDNRLGGGVGPARQIIQRWHIDYGVAYWVIEENLYRGGITNDELLSAYCAKEGITLISHETYGNKWDKKVGVSAMADQMKAGNISIPWGDVHTIDRWTQAKKQLINFSRDYARTSQKRSNAGRTDIPMAFWFPQNILRRWRREYLSHVAEADRQRDVSNYPFTPMSDIYESVYESVS